MRRDSLKSNDRGSVLMLSVGMVPILAGLVAVGTDVSVLFAQRRALSAEADAAALAAAQSADLRELYTGSGFANLPLDCSRARRVVDGRIGSSRSDSRAAKSRVTKFTCRNDLVSVDVSSQVTLPFSQHFGVTPQVDVVASATAQSPFR